MPTKLRKLKITHVAVCPQGANYDPATGEGAHVLLFKSAAPLHKEGDCTCTDDGKDTDCPVHGGVQKNDTCDEADCDDADCPVHGMAKQDAAEACTCTDAAPDPACPVHGASIRRRRQRRVGKYDQPFVVHPEPDGDETPPLDYASRGQQYDMWECLWGDWQCFCETVYDCLGDSDTDNLPYLPILLRSIDQFKADVAEAVSGLGLTEKMAPALGELTDVAKAGAAMAGHRRKRLQDAIVALQQLLDECTPEDLPHGIQPPIDHAGRSAAIVAGIPGYMKGATRMAETLEGMTKRAEAAEAQVATLAARGAEAEAQIQTLTARVAELEPLVAKTRSLETTIAKMQQTPEEQEAEYWASVPEPVRKKHEADEAEKVELRKQLQDAREEREQTVYITKTADFRGFGMVQKHWRILKALDRMVEAGITDAEDRDELLRLMKSASERDSTSELYRASGSEGRYGAGGASDSASATDQLMSLTEAYANEHTCSFAAASEKIAKAHPDLYRRASEERRRSARVSSE